MSEHRRTPRGFRIFAEDLGVCVQESSRACEGAYAWIFLGEDGKAVQLNVKQAEVAIAGLQEFVKAARADELTEPAECEQ